MGALITDLKKLYVDCAAQDFAFYMAACYLVFSYLRPQAIYPLLDIIPWTQLTIVAGLMYLIAKRRLRIQSVHTLLLVFCLVIVVSCYKSQYPDLSFSKLDIPFILLAEILFFTNCISNVRQFKLITIVFFLILFKMAFFGARTWVSRGFGFTDWGIAGPAGFFANSGEFSLLMAMIAVMSLAFFSGRKLSNKLYYCLPLFAVMSVLAASSRGGQLALLTGVLFLGFGIGKLKIKNILWLLMFGYIAIAVLPDKQKDRFASMGSDNTSTSRLLYWEKGLDMLNRYPVFGVGFYTFPAYFSDHYSYLKEEDSYIGKRAEVAHNSFIEVGSGLGYTGLACYVFMLLMCHSQNRSVRKIMIGRGGEHQWLYRYSIGLDAALVVYVVGSCFMSVAFYPYLYLLMMFSQVNLNGGRIVEADLIR